MKHTLELKRTATQNGIDLWQLEVGRLPVPSDGRPAIALFLQSLMHALAGRYQLTETVWLEATHIHEEGTTKLIGPHARAWVPRTGFGIHPKGPLPRMWTDDDFSGAPFGYKIPVFNNQVFEISRSTGHSSAIETMAGRGVLMILLLNGTVQAFKQQMNTVLGSLVKEHSFHAYPYFFPLLTASEAEDAQLQTWMGNADVYIRESAEDKAILIFSRIPLVDALRAIGSTEVSESTWHIGAEIAQ